MAAKAEQIKVIELFAGVGGFRLGLQQASPRYKVVWSNQWEPATKKQYASEVYTKRFGAGHHSNEDISAVATTDIPDHDMLVGGFPCQDYSVARTLNQAKGLTGKKGVLWWEIYRILKEKKKKPKYLLLENVDRLLKSPAKQRGRDFAIMLASLAELDYIVEWRVINAADYGMPQRRRRVFFIGYHKDTAIYKEIKKMADPAERLTKGGVMADAFKASASTVPTQFELSGDLAALSEEFNKGDGKQRSPFENTGIMIGRKVWTLNTKPSYKGKFKTLGDVLLKNGEVPKSYYIDTTTLERWKYMKGAKQEKRSNKIQGIEYNYTEGAMVFPDALDKPSRTIVTGEGGASPSRFKHVIQTADGKLRRLTPIELERLNMFPDNHTEGASDVKRAFFMGNALVVGIIEKIGAELAKKI